MKNNNRGLIITLIILLIIVVLLLTGLMVFVISGQPYKVIDFISDDKIVYDESFDKNEINALVIHSDAGDIDIKPSPDNTIRIVAKGGKANNVSVNNDNGNAVISNKSTSRPNFSLFSLNRNNIVADIDIYLPNDFSNVDITSKYGDVTIDGEFSGELKVQNDFGDIEADVLSGQFELHTDCGNIEIAKIDISSDSTATTDMGDIEIEYTNDIRIDADTSLGERKINEKDYKSDTVLTLKTDMGDIEVN